MNDPPPRSRRAAEANPHPIATLTQIANVAGMPAIRCLFQPIVDLGTERTVGFEALTRGIDDHSSTGNSDALFEWAQRTGHLRELDWTSRIKAMQSALALGFKRGCGLFLNIEPAALGGAAPEEFQAIVDKVRASGMAVVVEFTERALAENAAALLRLGDWVREQGWSVAVDDIGADPGSLALLPLLKPEIIKLDLRLIQSRTTVDVAQIVNAVNAEAGRTGAMVLAEGIETERHAALAVSMGAQLGQGWFYGRPASDPQVATEPLQVNRAQISAVELRADSPWELVAGLAGIRRAEKVLVEAISRHLERQAMASTDPVVVVGSFQNIEQYRASTARRFAALAAAGAVVAVLGRDVQQEPSAGVQGQHLSAHDPLTREWTIAVVTAHFAGALISLDCGDSGADSARRFDYLVTYDRATVLAAADIMLRRIVPRSTPAESGDRPTNITRRGGQAESVRQDRQLPLLARALASSLNGIVIADATVADLPLVYANHGFQTMTGYSAAEVLGRNCRFLQGPQTNGRAIDQLRAMLAAGEGGQVTLLNYRRDGTPFWNQLNLSPVADSAGQLTHFIAILADVSDWYTGEPGTRDGGKRADRPAVVPAGRPSAHSAAFSPYLPPSSYGGSPVVAASPVDAAAVRDPVPPTADMVDELLLQHSTLTDLNPSTFRTGLLDRGLAQQQLQVLLAEAGFRPAVLVASMQWPDSEPGTDLDPDLLIRVAQVVSASVAGAVVFRNAAAEFGILCRLAGRNAVVEAYAIAGRMHQAVLELAADAGVSLSVGIAMWPDDGDTAKLLWQAAEAALVYAEDSGPRGTRYATDIPTQRRSATGARTAAHLAPVNTTDDVEAARVGPFGGIDMADRQSHWPSW